MDRGKKRGEWRWPIAEGTGIKAEVPFFRQADSRFFETSIMVPLGRRQKTEPRADESRSRKFHSIHLVKQIK
eukprot:scaffold29511_cov154-Skeletonema_menzelii.AAC.3